MPRIPFILKMFNKKGQQMDPKELVLTLVIVGIVAIVGVLIFSKVSNTTDNLFDPTTNTATNETVTISKTATTDTNSTLLAQAGYIANSEVVKNGTAPFANLTRDIEYKITLVGPDGGLTTRANFTLFNITDGVGNDSTFNNSELFITYRFNTRSAAQTSVETIEDTVLDSFELGVIALIVLAAVAILAVLFRLGSQ